VMKKARRLEWLTLGYMLSAVILLALVLGQSQAMKAAWIEDTLALLPPLAFLIAARIRDRPATGKFPWGMERAVSIAFLAAALALFVLGVLVFFDSALKLVSAEHAPIGVVPVFGEEVWLGWLMIAALLWSAVPSLLLGLRKRKLADRLHDKVLFADAGMNRANWLTASAAMLGVLGIGVGLWWADSVAAIVIAVDVTRDGWRNVRASTQDLMDARPRRHDNKAFHPVVDQMEEELRSLSWVSDSAVRLREEGHVFTGQVHVVPEDDENLVDRLEEAEERLTGLDWKVHDLAVVPVTEIEIPPPLESADEDK
jgi:cation diffusion facilitator family transporter